MRRRSRAGGEPAKTRRRKMAARKRGNAPKVARHHSRPASQETEVARLTRERDEALEQWTAAAEILKVISRSTFNLQTVLDALVKSATHLCEAQDAFIFLPDGEVFRAAARFGFTPKYHKVVEANPVRIDRGSVAGRTALEGRVVHVHDVLADPNFTRHDLQKIGGFRAALGVPLLRERKVIGVIFLSRTKPQPFADKQIELVKNFAIQAVIAIENTRLLNELRQRTTDLTESLEQQTATSEVLKVISSSPGELELVFHAMLENATRICGAKFGILFRHDGGLFHPAASLDVPPAYADFLRRQGSFAPQADQLFGQLSETKRVIHIVDRATDRDPSPSVRYGGARSSIAVPMIKENELLGAFFIYRTEVRPFTDKQIALVQNFAAQAVIAIENTRLLNELRQSLEQQTATAEVLRVISSSPGELEPVFQAMLANAMHICGANFGNLLLVDGEGLRSAASHNYPPAYAKMYESGPLRPGPHTGLGRTMRTKQVVHILDLAADRAYADRDPLRVMAVEVLKARTFLGVPMLKEDILIGAIVIYSQEVRPFTDKQIALVQNFAAQAVIAIENTRLLNELRQRTNDLTESLEQQTATSEVLTVISSSPGDLQPVFSAMLESAARLCDASFGNIFRWDDDALRLVASYNTPAAFVEARSQFPLRRAQNNPIGEMLAAKTVLHVHDLAADERYTKRRDPNIVAAVELGGVRTFLAVPMLKDNELIGALIVYRQEVRPFSDKQIELVKNFAAQAVIAIENARLLNELRRNRCSSRPLLPTCSRSSAVRRSICSLCSIRWWSCGAAVRGALRRSISPGSRLATLGRPLQLPGDAPSATPGRVSDDADPRHYFGSGSPHGCYRFKFPTCLLTRNTEGGRRRRLIFGACSRCPCSGAGEPSARS